LRRREGKGKTTIILHICRIQQSLKNSKLKALSLYQTLL
jgi:hypothetical protein